MHVGTPKPPDYKMQHARLVTNKGPRRLMLVGCCVKQRPWQGSGALAEQPVGMAALIRGVQVGSWGMLADACLLLCCVFVWTLCAVRCALSIQCVRVLTACAVCCSC
jgi:hypothetical protein